MPTRCSNEYNNDSKYRDKKKKFYNGDIEVSTIRWDLFIK